MPALKNPSSRLEVSGSDTEGELSDGTICSSDEQVLEKDAPADRRRSLDKAGRDLACVTTIVPADDSDDGREEESWIGPALGLFVATLGCLGVVCWMLESFLSAHDADDVAKWCDNISWEFPAAMSGVYLLMVAILPTGSRRPLARNAVKESMKVYNCFQVVFNASWCVAVTLFLWKWGQPIAGAPRSYDAQGAVLAYLIWAHYFNKCLQLLDTVFMILRDRTEQVTFLHVYQHLLMVWAWWIVCRYWNGGDAWFGAWVNSFVQMLMYSYYLMSAVAVSCPWKRYLTMLRLLQLVICLGHGLLCIHLESVAPWICCLQLFVSSTLVLFMAFYGKCYPKRRGKTK